MLNKCFVVQMALLICACTLSVVSDAWGLICGCFSKGMGDIFYRIRMFFDHSCRAAIAS